MKREALGRVIRDPSSTYKDIRRMEERLLRDGSSENLGILAQNLAARGIRLLENEPVRGAGNFICNFLAPAYTRGIIVEYVQLVENG